MAAQTTHQHRNLIDDVLDLGLLAGGLGYFIFADRLGLALTATELAAIASSGAAMRILVRKILMRIWGKEIVALEATSAVAPTVDTLEPVEPEAEAEPAPSETPTAAPEAPAEESDDKPIVPPPPVVGGG